MTTDTFIPRSCEECIKSKYKLQKPDCAYEQGLEHKKTYAYFKSTYNLNIKQHLDSMITLKKQREECLEHIKGQASRMIALRKALDIDSLIGKIVDLNERIEDIENYGKKEKKIDYKDRILAPPKEEPDAYERKIVKQAKPIHKDETKKKEDDAKDATPLKDRGWLMYVRNTKKENVERYVSQLKAEHPELTDDQIKISVNAVGNYMVRYTLNPDLS